MLIRALAVPFIFLLSRLQVMIKFVVRGFSLIGVLGFLVRLFEVRLRRASSACISWRSRRAAWQAP